MRVCSKAESITHSSSPISLVAPPSPPCARCRPPSASTTRRPSDRSSWMAADLRAGSGR